MPTELLSGAQDTRFWLGKLRCATSSILDCQQTTMTFYTWCVEIMKIKVEEVKRQIYFLINI